MKKRIMGITACILTLVITFSAEIISSDEYYRYHQHREAPEKTECSHSGSVFCTHLPLVQINTNGEDIPGTPLLDENGKRYAFATTKDGKDELLCNIKITDSETGNNHIYDAPTTESGAKVRIRGNSSRYFDKKGYSVRLVTESGENNPQAVMGMDAHHEWVLHGPFLDKTLIRNYVCYNIAGEIMGYAPNVRFCELIINGEYLGLYLCTETVTAGKDGARLNVSVDKKNNTYSGYVLRLDRGSDTALKNIEPFSLYSERISDGHINIVYPGTSGLTEEMSENIRQDFSDFEHMLYSFDFDNSKYGYTKVTDVDSFVDYFIINEFTCNHDAGSYSTYIYKGIDNKYRMCVWDFNNAFDNYQEQAMDTEEFALQECLWYFMLIKDEDFTDAIVRRYRELRKTCLSEEYLYNYIDETVSYLGAAIDRNYEKWGYSFESGNALLRPEARHVASFDEAVGQLKGFISKRGKWMDENIETIRQYSATSKSKLYKEHTR